LGLNPKSLIPPVDNTMCRWTSQNLFANGISTTNVLDDKRTDHATKKCAKISKIARTARAISLKKWRQRWVQTFRSLFHE